MRRVLREDGLLLLGVRDYDTIRAARPRSAPPQVATTAQGRAVTFRLWHWREDGERGDRLPPARPHGTTHLTVGKI
ncbi:hypothetical protein [Streptomyces hokutonensis]|uniref:hypothetical protein n=1 Tax=Streptomyces hokutonensis TaxID=1306990 RepID=UPI001319CCF9|nr:hypothetical protein [Streptomyces hokutonensis]